MGRARLPSGHITFCLVFCLLLSSCAPTRPVRKIGLLAPFEGLHRESGYNALSAMRSAINDHPLAGVEILPLALDTSASPSQARRAAHKLLRDGSVFAVIGPLQASEVSAVTEVMADRNPDWQLPFGPGTHESAQAYIEALMIEIAGRNIALAGMDATWPQLSPNQWSTATGKTVTVAVNVGDAAGADGVLWLGDAPGGATFLGLLREQDNRVPFWTTSIGSDPVFTCPGQIGRQPARPRLLGGAIGRRPQPILGLARRKCAGRAHRGRSLPCHTQGTNPVSRSAGSIRRPGAGNLQDRQ